ncbi:MAG: magnesium-translocating P-type ATPase [Nitrospira sp.]|nr:magnesium-translocating P-type ATPase [Nitrospira sp.]MCP9441827.1 magnesium-translocating P-type ATPase [Nitrospira sp.]
MTLAWLKELFAAFLRARRIVRHFRRLAWLDTLTQVTVNRTVPPSLAHSLVNAATANPDVLLAEFNSHADGLSESQAEVIRDRVGFNEVDHEKPLSWWHRLWLSYRNPFNLLLTVLAVVSWFTEDWEAAVVIGAMVALSTLLRFVQEAKANKAADALKAMVTTTATVIRRDVSEDAAPIFEKFYGVQLHVKPARRVEVPIRLLVPGDVIALSAGDMIPADCRVLSAKDLFVSQAAMTGEAMPVEKFAVLRDAKGVGPLDLDNILFMGTTVVSGSATAVVIATGKKTYFGTLATSVTASGREPTSFQAGVNQVSWLLIRFMFVMAPLVFLINGFTKGNWMDALLFALSIAVGLTPEMLPLIVTSTLAKGAVFLSRKKVIVKRLDSIQNFGAMDVLCTDKTGTLTQDKIFLERHVDVWGEDSDEVLHLAYLNSYYQTGLKNLLDVAVLEHAEVRRKLDPAKNYRKVDEIPFDFTRRRMSVVVSEREDHHELICKGAVEEILSVCTKVRHGDRTEPLVPELLAQIRRVTADLNEEGLRVVAVAMKEVPPTKETYGVGDESDLTLIGYVAFLDPPKESAAPALKALAEHGVSVKVLTGDNELVTAKICREVELEQGGVLLGGEIEKMSDEELAKAVEWHRVFAKLTPAHKERIVRLLKSNGHVVGFMGDGINDAPALRTADIGISVDTAVDIAKEAADIILLEKSLLVLEEGVLEGRRTFANMLKYIKMTASSNFGNVFSVLVASAFLPFLPMLPIHLLVQNLLYDISQIAIPLDNVDKDLLQKPQRWQPRDIGRFMVFFGPISSLFDILTFAMMWVVFGADTPEEQTLFQSGWFLVGLFTQTLIVHLIRTPRVPFLQSRASIPLLVMTGAMMTIGLLIPMGPLAASLKLQTLPPLYFVFLPMILGGYMGLTQAMKGLYIRRYGWQ